MCGNLDCLGCNKSAASRSIFKSVKTASKEGKELNQVIINLWLLFVLLFLFLYANLSVGKSWPVMWFYLGFAVSVFVFDKSTRKIKSNIANELAAHG